MKACTSTCIRVGRGTRGRGCTRRTRQKHGQHAASRVLLSHRSGKHPRSCAHCPGFTPTATRPHTSARLRAQKHMCAGARTHRRIHTGGGLCAYAHPPACPACPARAPRTHVHPPASMSDLTNSIVSSNRYSYACPLSGPPACTGHMCTCMPMQHAPGRRGGEQPQRKADGAWRRRGDVWR